MPSKDKKYGLGTNKPYEFKLPSGNTCLMKNLTMDDLMKIGILDRLDSLTSIVSAEHVTRVTGTPQQRAAAAQALAELDTETAEGRQALLGIMKDKGKWEAMQSFINVVVKEAVVDPHVSPEPGPHETKMDNVLYASDVDLLDRMAIMQRCMGGMMDGVKAMEPFRSGSGETVVNLPEGQDVRNAAVGASGGDI